MNGNRAPDRWKNIALTVYLICPLALVTGLCVWAMVSLQQRVEKAGKAREVPVQDGMVSGSPSPESSEEATKIEEGSGGDETPGNSPDERSESGG